MNGMSTVLDNVKRVIEENYDEGSLGLFFTPNIVGDTMCEIYRLGNVRVLICYGYEYFEVFGLSNEEQKELEKFYYGLEEKETRK